MHENPLEGEKSPSLAPEGLKVLQDQEFKKPENRSASRKVIIGVGRWLNEKTVVGWLDTTKPWNPQQPIQESGYYDEHQSPLTLDERELAHSLLNDMYDYHKRWPKHLAGKPVGYSIHLRRHYDEFSPPDEKYPAVAQNGEAWGFNWLRTIWR